MLTLELITQADDARPVFITGNFNGWVTKDERFRMRKLAEGHYEYAFSAPLPDAEPLEYKYVKGGWDGEELDADGHPPVNRRMEVPRGKVTDIVPQWKAHGDWYNPDFYPDIRILSKHFKLPKLSPKRRISILLPWNYEKSGKRYPVLYLQDGQNLFEDEAPFGTWGVDKHLAALSEKGNGDFIVVAIDHGGKERIREFSPYDSQKWGEGLGKDYAHFLTETLKPYIDAEFRTLPDRSHTGIGGSSMGGLISIYAGILFPEVYSKFMVFSPSLWVTPRVYYEPFQFASYPSTRIYLYAGGKEGAGMLTNAKRFKQTMEKRSASRVQLHLEIDPEGLHNEARWGQEFPKAAEWLYKGKM
ncbi:MAG: carbohydrate esterase [Bacteroidetes bacterium]|nr:MAG: carbohydrate esterase [Bacteroidota bacterium]